MSDVIVSIRNAGRGPAMRAYARWDDDPIWAGPFLLAPGDELNLENVHRSRGMFKPGSPAWLTVEYENHAGTAWETRILVSRPPAIRDPARPSIPGVHPHKVEDVTYRKLSKRAGPGASTNPIQTSTGAPVVRTHRQ
jgi:hypothetical protein